MTLTARQQYEDRGENLDVSQVFGVGGVILSGQTYNNQLYGQAMAQDNVTAHAGGGQGAAVVITGPMMRITTVATTGDSVLLPPAIRGVQVAVVNDAASNACNVFPSGANQGGVAGGDTINSLGANNPYSLTTGISPTIFFCFSNGFWRTK